MGGCDRYAHGPPISEAAIHREETRCPCKVTARLPDPVVEALDKAATRLGRSRAEVIRLAVEPYIEDFDDLSVAIDRLRDPGDPVLNWDQIRRELLDTD